MSTSPTIQMDLPLKGLVVLEFCQYLSGPSAGLRLADLGARVIKIERPGKGDAGRKLAIKDLWVDENSLLFHSINRNKESFTADLANPADLELVYELIRQSNVMIHNYRPGSMRRKGLDYDGAAAINPRIVYAEISGYGTEGPWKDKPGQDLLLQSVAGLAYTTGNGNQSPVPFGISISDILCGAQLVQGILAALIRRHKTGRGAHIEISLMETLLDFQFELMTTYYTDRKQPLRSHQQNGHPLLGAPYGLYATADGFIALAMMDLEVLSRALDCPALRRFDKSEAFAGRDAIKEIITLHLIQQSSAYWLERLHAHELWSMEVLDWKQLTAHDGYRVLQMEQQVKAGDATITTTRCPIRINGERLYASKPAPALGEHNESILSGLKMYVGE